MKRLYLLGLFSTICFLLTSCGIMKSATDSIVTESPIIETTLQLKPTLRPSPSIETDRFIGEYRVLKTDEPGLGLQICKDEEDYRVEIEVLGKYRLPCCPGQLVDGKIEFNLLNRGVLRRVTVTVEDGIATVTFLDDCWDVIHAGDTFVYHKVSNIPYEQYNEWKKEHPSPAIKEEDFIGIYNEDITNRSNLEIKRNEDGTFQVQFTIHRVIVSDLCVGKFVDDAIEFTFQHLITKSEMKGRITLENGYAILTISSEDWKNIDDGNRYFFYKVSDMPQDEQEMIQTPPAQTDESEDARDLLYEAFLKNETSVANPYVEGMNLTVMGDRDYESEFEDAKKKYSYVDVNGDENAELIFKISSYPDELMYVLGVYDNELVCFDVFETHSRTMAFGVYNNGFVWEVKGYDGFEKIFYTYTADGQPMRARYFTEENKADIATQEEETEWIEWSCYAKKCCSKNIMSY